MHISLSFKALITIDFGGEQKTEDTLRENAVHLQKPLHSLRRNIFKTKITALRFMHWKFLIIRKCECGTYDCHNTVKKVIS